MYNNSMVLFESYMQSIQIGLSKNQKIYMTN